MSSTDQYMQDIIDLHQVTHEQMREVVTGVGGDCLNWMPAPDTSSIGTLVTHALGAEAEMLRNLLQIPTNRDRSLEFDSLTHDHDQLLRLLDAADDDWQQLAPRVGDPELRAAIPRPGKPVPQSGLFWLVRNYGHMREHLAQMQLNKQLYQAKDH